MIGSHNNPTSSLSCIRPEASAADAGHSLHSQDLGPVPVVPGGGVIPTLSIVTSTVSRSVNSSGSMNLIPGQSMGINLPSTRPPLNPLNNSLTLSEGSWLVGHKPPETAWLGAPKAAEGCQGLPTTGYWNIQERENHYW
jgi:hypothetical protein